MLLLIIVFILLIYVSTIFESNVLIKENNANGTIEINKNYYIFSDHVRDKLMNF